MCGIVGIITKDSDVALDLYRALLALQHRGQDSAGIACQDKVRVNLKKGIGLVGDIFTEENLSLLKGNYGIAHVRYSTIGGSLKKDAQPFLVGHPNLITIAHNGNILNYDELTENFKDTLESNSDTEIILHIFAEYLKDKALTNENIFDAIKQVMTKLNGSYSIVGTIAGIGLFAFRDPHGIRPLAFGKKNEDYIFASESVAIDTLGYTLIRDINPGEAILIKENCTVFEKIILQKETRHCMFEWIYFARPDSVIDGKSVYLTRIELGKNVARRIKFKGDVVSAVPDTSRPAAYGISRELNLFAEEGLIKNRYVGRTFIMPTQKQRDKAIYTKLNPNKAVLTNKNVILVDDSIVRGTTSKKIVKVIKKYCNKLCFVSTCPPLISPCYYGVDFPLKEELIAHKRNIEEIKNEIECDDLVYAEIEDVQNSIGTTKLCMACITGNYPTEVTQKLENKIRRAREKEREKINKENCSSSL